MTPASRSVIIVCLFLLASAWLVTGCASHPSRGYSLASTYRDDVQTIAVPIFENTTFSHGLEFALTEAVIKEIHRVSPWRVVEESSAQTTLRGTITGSGHRPLNRQRESGLGQEMAVRLTVGFEWKQNATGEVLVVRRRFQASDTFVPTRPAGERLETGQQAAVERLARDIVSELRSSW